MASLCRLENTDNDPFVMGILVTWDDPGASPVQKVVSFRSEQPCKEEQTARVIVEQLIERVRDTVWLNATNWVSLTAAVCALLEAWNGDVMRVPGASEEVGVPQGRGPH